MSSEDKEAMEEDSPVKPEEDDEDEDEEEAAEGGGEGFGDEKEKAQKEKEEEKEGWRRRQCTKERTLSKTSPPRFVGNGLYGFCGPVRTNGSSHYPRGHPVSRSPTAPGGRDPTPRVGKPNIPRNQRGMSGSGSLTRGFVF